MKFLWVFAFLATVYALPKFQQIHSSVPNAYVKLPKHFQPSQFDLVKNGVSPVSFLTEVSDYDESNGAEDYESEEELTFEDLIKLIQKIINEKLLPYNGNSVDESNIPFDISETNPHAITLKPDDNNIVEGHENGQFSLKFESGNESGNGNMATTGSIQPKGPKHSEQTEVPKDNTPDESEATESYEGSGFSQDIISEPSEGSKVSKWSGGSNASGGITSAGVTQGLTSSEAITTPELITTSGEMTIPEGITAPQGITAANGITVSEEIAESEGITKSEENEISVGTEASEITKQLGGTEISAETKAFQEIKASQDQQPSVVTYSSKSSKATQKKSLPGQFNYLNVANTLPKFYYKAA